MNTVLLWIMLATSHDGGMMQPMYFRKEEECKKVAAAVPGRYVRTACVQAEVYVK